MPPIGNVVLSKVVLEHNLPRLSWPWIVGRQVDLKPKPVNFGKVAAAYCSHMAGKVGTWRINRDPGAVTDEVRRAGQECAVFGDFSLHDIGRKVVDKLIDGLENKLFVNSLGTYTSTERRWSQSIMSHFAPPVANGYLLAALKLKSGLQREK